MELETASPGRERLDGLVEDYLDIKHWKLSVVHLVSIRYGTKWLQPSGNSCYILHWRLNGDISMFPRISYPEFLGVLGSVWTGIGAQMIPRANAWPVFMKWGNPAGRELCRFKESKTSKWSILNIWRLINVYSPPLMCHKMSRYVIKHKHITTKCW